MSASLRRGWCPGALRPMAAADGLVVRLRITGGILAAETAHALAHLAARHGNGKFDLTSRANLQMRGIGEGTLPALLDALRALCLVDADAEAEAVRNVVASPLAGLHEGLDIRPLAAALEARLADTRALHALPAKFLFLIDDGSTPSLADVPADVRFDWSADAASFAVGLGGTRADAVAAGPCAAHDLVDRAETIARGALAGFAQVRDARRMRTLVAKLGQAKVLRLCAPPSAERHLPSPLAGEGARRVAGEGARRADEGSPPEESRGRDSGSAGNALSSAGCAGTFSREGRRRGAARRLSAPYGRLDARMLLVAAELARTGLGELRLTPWRSVFLPGVVGPGDRAKEAGWIVVDDDPRLAVAACVGAPDCERASTRTRADADMLAELAAPLSGARPALHVSGCTKGCAHAAAAPLVLVGRDGRYDLVRDGRAGDPPVRSGLDLAEARAALAESLD